MREADENRKIPGTILDRDKMGGVTGLDFLNKVFFISDYIMLAQIKEITGIDGTTLQNWLKRGWVGAPNKKSYTKEHLARILLVNMMRGSMQLSRIIFTLEYINGKEEQDKIIDESLLYDCVCRMLTRLSDKNAAGLGELDGIIDDVLRDYNEPVTGAYKRLRTGVRVITITYYSSMIKAEAEAILDELGAIRSRKR